MSDFTRAFLRAWLEWAESETPEESWFSGTAGLCHNAYVYDQTQAAGVQRDLVNMFEADGLCGGYPFGMDAYDNHHAAGTQHKDPNRLAWVRKQLSAV